MSELQLKRRASSRRARETQKLSRLMVKAYNKALRTHVAENSTQTSAPAGRGTIVVTLRFGVESRQPSKGTSERSWIVMVHNSIVNEYRGAIVEAVAVAVNE